MINPNTSTSNESDQNTGSNMKDDNMMSDGNNGGTILPPMNSNTSTNIIQPGGILPTPLSPPIKPIHLVQPQPIVSYPSLQPTNSDSSSGGGSAHSNTNIANRFSPYTASSANLTFQEKWEMVEQITSMFPLLEKDPSVYATLQKNGWVVDTCINEFQKRHEILEERNKRRTEKVKSMTEPLIKQKLTESSEMKDIEDEDDSLDNLDEGNESQYDNQYIRKSKLKSSILSDLDDIIDEDDIYEDELQNTSQDSQQDQMMDSGTTNTNNNNNLFKPANPSQSALQFSRFPHLKEHIQTLRDIFGNSYHEYELKSFYVACNGNLELVIDQIVHDQIKSNVNKASDPNVAPNVEPPKPEPKKSLTDRLSEEEKRAIQLQLIEEQEKLEKKFSDKKKNDIKNHPSKKNFSQQEIVNELKDLFGKSVDDGVIEWVAYRCNYELGDAVTQLVDIKHNSLLKKGTLSPPNLDQNTQNMISQNLEILSKQNLANAGVNLDSFADEMSKKLTANDTDSPNTILPQKNIFFNGLTPPSTTTTTTTSNSNSPPNPNVNNNNNNINPFFQSTFNYNNNKQG